MSFGELSYCSVCGLGGLSGRCGPSGRHGPLYKLLVFSLQVLVVSLGSLGVFAGKIVFYNVTTSNFTTS